MPNTLSQERQIVPRLPRGCAPCVFPNALVTTVRVYIHVHLMSFALISSGFPLRSAALFRMSCASVSSPAASLEACRATRRRSW